MPTKKQPLKVPAKNPDTRAIEKRVRASTGNPKDTKAAVNWLLQHVRQAISGRIDKSMFQNVSRGREGIGRMYFFAYDPKHKDTLPYYDKFPLAIPIALYDDGFLGLNLHYLPPIARAKLLDQLMVYERNAGTPRAYMQLSYDMLNQVAKVKGYDACIKRYLTTHIKTRLIKVENEHWETAAMLPVQEFRKASKTTIWKGRK